MPPQKTTDSIASKKDDSRQKDFNFETSLDELEKLVVALENGDLNLEQSLKDFERGIQLTRSCQQALHNAQQKVQILVSENGRTELKDYIKPDQ